MASPLPVPLIASAVGALGTFLVFNAQGASIGTGLPAAAIVGLLLYYFIQVVTQQPNLQPTESVKPKKKTKQEKPKQKPVSTSSSSVPSASSAASDEEDEPVTSAKKKGKKANKKAAAAAAAAAAVAQPEENESEASEASETSEGDDEDDSSSLSKNAKKKAKKKAAAAAAKKEEEKKAAAAAAAAAAAKKPTANKKEEKKSAPAPAPVAAQPTPAAASAKKEKKPTKESAPATPAQPAAVALAPPQEEEAFQQSKSDKKKKQKDEKAKKREEEKQTQSKPTEVPKTPTPISPAPAASNKKQETKPQAAAAAPVSFSPPPAAEFEEGEWNIAKSAKPTSAQKKEIKAAESKSAESAPSSASNTAEPSDWIDIPVAKVAAIIGTKGAVLKALQEGTGATIEVPKAAERDLQSLTARILIRGEISQVKHAKSCVKSLAEKGYSSVTHPGFGDDDIYVEGKQHGLIIGPKGSTLKTIQTKTGTMIRMPEKGGNDRIIIVGPKDGVKQAKEAIKQLVSDGFSSLTHDGHEKKEIDFPASKLGILIGPGGQTIKSIQGNSKAQIKIPARDAENQKVIVTGPAAAIAQAEKEILKLLEPKVKKTNKPEEGKDDEESAVAGEATTEGANGDAAPQSAFDAWNAAEVPQVNNEDAMWQ